MPRKEGESHANISEAEALSRRSRSERVRKSGWPPSLSQSLDALSYPSVMSSSKALSSEQVASAQIQGDYTIKPETAQPKLDTSQWPLLLKNYDKLLVRSGHFTPIPTGCSPLKRDIQSYVKCVSIKMWLSGPIDIEQML